MVITLVEYKTTTLFGFDVPEICSSPPGAQDVTTTMEPDHRHLLCEGGSMIKKLQIDARFHFNNFDASMKGVCEVATTRRKNTFGPFQLRVSA